MPKGVKNPRIVERLRWSFGAEGKGYGQGTGNNEKDDEGEGERDGQAGERMVDITWKTR